MSCSAASPQHPTMTSSGQSTTGLLRQRIGEARLRELLGRVTLTAGSHATAPLEAPFSGEPIFDIPLGTASDIEEAANRARRAQTAWAATPFRTRAKIFLRYHDLILERQAEVLDLIQLETGKARRHAVEEDLDVAINCRHYAYHGGRELRPHRRRGALPFLTASWELHLPLGVIGFITPWNYPLALGISDAIPALLAGNAVILKPDQQTPFTALWGVDLLVQAGLPPDLFQVVTGRGRELGGPLISHVNFICFTGSTSTGRIIATQAGERLIGCSLELGGKNPLIVLGDAHLGAAVEGAVRVCFASSGQLCISTERLYVEKRIYQPFMERFAARVRSMKLGADDSFDTEMGSLTSKDQADKMQSHVDDAVAKGATVLAGGRRRTDLGPYFVEPTLLENVTPSMKVFAEETFGPLVSAYAFENDDELVERANDSCYGLNASIWTPDTRRGRRIAARLRTGTVNINEGYKAAWGSVDAPMGGFKDSGLGRRHGVPGLLKYTEAQTVSVQRLMPIAPPVGMTEERFARVLTFMVGMLRRIPGIR